MAVSGEDVVVTYCGCKISKVRWSPVSSGQKISETFVTGSADNDVSDSTSASWVDCCYFTCVCGEH